MKLKVRIEAEAEAQIAQLDAWWREHRTAATSLKELLAETFQKMAEAPYAAPVYLEVGGEQVRRRGIKTTPYAVYYWIDKQRGDIAVISIWSTQRGRGPALKVR